MGIKLSESSKTDRSVLTEFSKNYYKFISMIIMVMGIKLSESSKTDRSVLTESVAL